MINRSIPFDVRFYWDGESERQHYFRVTGTVSPAIPGKMHMPNGDPGYPDEPAEVEPVETFLVREGVGDGDDKERKIDEPKDKDWFESLENKVFEVLCEESDDRY